MTKHQLYSVIRNRTIVDKELVRILNCEFIIVVLFSHKIVYCIYEDFCSSMPCVINVVDLRLSPIEALISHEMDPLAHNVCIN